MRNKCSFKSGSWKLFEAAQEEPYNINLFLIFFFFTVFSFLLSFHQPFLVRLTSSAPSGTLTFSFSWHTTGFSRCGNTTKGHICHCGTGSDMTHFIFLIFLSFSPKTVDLFSISVVHFNFCILMGCDRCWHFAAPPRTKCSCRWSGQCWTFKGVWCSKCSSISFKIQIKIRDLISILKSY